MRAEKQLLLNEIKEKIDGSKALIISRYEKLPANGSWELRNRLGKGCEFEVVRKRVFKKAAEICGIQIDESLLQGHIGVAFISQPDATAFAKTLVKYSEENAQTLQMLMGLVEGKIIPGSELELLSKLPGIDEMRAQILALFVSPMSQVLAVFDAAMAGPLKDPSEQNS